MARVARSLTLVIAALALLLAVRAVIAEPFTVPSESMEPSLNPGERIIVPKWPGQRDVARGDIVVFDGSGTFGPVGPPPSALDRALGTLAGHSADSVYVKRVIAVGGERIACCDTRGRLTLDGVALDEPYVSAGDAPSDVTFDVVVPAGRLWLMGDRRARSKDSRSHRGSPGGGTVSVETVIGPAAFRYWPADRIGTL
ncbi:MAG: signal peptidase I [Dermatophilaceae bacterium]